MLCPRILGLSESAWTLEKNKRNGKTMNILATNNFRDLFEQIGWEYYRSENFDIMPTSNTINEEGLTSESVHTNV